ncbi:hypothetical protein CKAH01_00898 [Colletotrichum kahawae]|uniref:Uncharacterized protein n=1 Tax=Colletotrichum kahawae TaxID=34407 RepID=A0AAD9YIR2_COLKA|nr:hypothetical protein CKAH01_00898 [Colletotrichum kahawae]
MSIETRLRSPAAARCAQLCMNNAAPRITLISSFKQTLANSTEDYSAGRPEADADTDASSEKIPWNTCHTDLNFHNAQKKK